MFMDISKEWASFDLRIALVVFLIYVVVDGMYAYYTLEVTKRNPFSSATTSALMHFLLAAGVLSYVHNFLYIFPIAIGSWVGTFFVVKKEQQIHKKNL